MWFRMAQKFCRNCGAAVDSQAEICPSCGVRIRQATPLRSPGLAAVLSFLWPGLGQIYNGQFGKAIAFILVGIILVLSMFILIGFILYPLFWFYNIYDAYRSAQSANETAVI